MTSRSIAVALLTGAGLIASTPPPSAPLSASDHPVALQAPVALLAAVAQASSAAQAPTVPQGEEIFPTSDRCLACHKGVTTSTGQDVSIGFEWRASIGAPP